MMALFDWFKSKPSNATLLDDVIWLTSQAKREGIARSILQRSNADGPPVPLILIAHFRDCHDELKRIAGSIATDGSVAVYTSGQLQREDMSRTAYHASQKVDILVGERHPLPSHDEAILEFARALPGQSTVTHHISLADPFLRAFCGEWVKELLKKLGMAEGEAIQSHLVARRIKAAQREIADQVPNEFPAETAEMWMEQNCPEVWQKVQG
jgi:hypothetical protein